MKSWLTTATEAPAAANTRAVTRPMPREAPVIRTTLPVREPGLLREVMKGYGTLCWVMPLEGLRSSDILAAALESLGIG